MIQESSWENQNSKVKDTHTNIDTSSNRKNNTLKNYKIIYTIFFKYGIFIFIIIIAAAIFFLWIKKEKILVVENDNEAQEAPLIKDLNEKINEIEKIEKNNNDIDIQIKYWLLNTYENMIVSYDNLISYKWFTLPRWVFFYDLESIEDKEYFENDSYDIEQLNKFIKNIILIDDSEIIWKDVKEPTYAQLKENNIEKTFYLSCVNRPKIFNRVCDKYIDNFLNWFFVYNIKIDIQWFTKIAKNLVTRQEYKQEICEWINKYIKYSNSAPNELDDIITLCWWTYLNEFYKMQNFLKTKNELDEKLITTSISKYKEINEYKLISFQQIIYNNLEKWIPPYEWMYKSYINYVSNILKKHSNNPIDPFYYDITYRFNNLYISPNLNKIKYQLTTTKKEEIDSILTELEKINNWDKIDWYIWLKFVLTNKSLEENVKNYWTNFNTERDDIMEVLLKNLKKLNYIKIISDEIDWNIIKINWYISIDFIPIPFGSTLENKNWKLIVKDFSLNLFWIWFWINDILEIILAQRDYSVWEVYEYIQKNIALYDSNNYNITPCNSIENRLKESSIEWVELLVCDENKINIIKWWSGTKILYQFKMDKYNITSIKTTDKKIQTFIDEDFSWINTNSSTIGNAVRSVITYTPTTETGSSYLEWSSDAIIAIEDLKTYLWVDIQDIWERNGKAAAEFNLGGIDLIGIYDTKTKKLWPVFLKLEWKEKEEIIINNFSIYLTHENQNEINKFLIEPIWYLYKIDKAMITKYFPELVEELLNPKK